MDNVLEVSGTFGQVTLKNADNDLSNMRNVHNFKSGTFFNSQNANHIANWAMSIIVATGQQ